MKWFGTPWDAPICEDGEQVQAPRNAFCGDCSQPIRGGDQGVILPYEGPAGSPRELPYHLHCIQARVAKV